MSLRLYAMFFVTIVGVHMHNIDAAKKCMVIGHRGACGYAPENTLSSLKKAIEIGVDMIEFDVHLCASGELVVLHDDMLDRTTNTTGYIANKTLEQLRDVVVEGNERIPTLVEAIDTIGRSAKIAIELKGRDTALATADIVQRYLEKGWEPEDFYILSFDHYQLEVFYSMLPLIKRCANICGMPLDIQQYAQKHGFNVIAIEYENISQAIIDAVHAHGVEIFAYTVNDRYKIKQLILQGVDGIFSDYPDRIKEALQEINTMNQR